MTDEEDPYSMDDLNLDPSTATWVDGAVWIEGKLPDGRDISAGFEPVNTDPTDADVEVHDDGITFRAFGRFKWLHEVGEGANLPVEE